MQSLPPVQACDFHIGNGISACWLSGRGCEENWRRFTEAVLELEGSVTSYIVEHLFQLRPTLQRHPSRQQKEAQSSPLPPPPPPPASGCRTFSFSSCQSISVIRVQGGGAQLINRRMYFKERERSSLYKREQQLEQARLTQRLEEIRSRKLRGCDSENRLPTITHRPSQPRPCQKAALQMETQRLGKRILQLKTNKSQYFQKVIGVNLLEGSRGRKEAFEGKSPPRCNRSALEPGSDACSAM